ncbi:hypothetical protein BZA05DRAFT_384627 [Tricharina praecox]|uniref:uncharacterized protein n=1 Tax=Tricharina praecox TaxID=43433 RepID=UPI002220E712|nr:uncharacterized protein BZA05DRAFT_384627 [Tricharina praecox]KAI5857727.1 hypothetical protein BZA05DRAFT_384627 [Tricharina praecox]
MISESSPAQSSRKRVPTVTLKTFLRPPTRRQTLPPSQQDLRLPTLAPARDFAVAKALVQTLAPVVPRGVFEQREHLPYDPRGGRAIGRLGGADAEDQITPAERPGAVSASAVSLPWQEAGRLLVEQRTSEALWELHLEHDVDDAGRARFAARRPPVPVAVVVDFLLRRLRRRHERIAVAQLPARGVVQHAVVGCPVRVREQLQRARVPRCGRE